MAMTVAGLKAKILLETNNFFGVEADEGSDELQDYAESLAKAIVEYIQANATVNVNSGNAIYPVD